MSGVSITQNQKLAQTQVLSPQMQQSLSVLQAPTLELRHLVFQELAQNPTLETESSEVSLEEAGLEQAEGEEDFDNEFSRLSQMDDEWREYLSQSRTRGPRTAEDEERRQFLFDSLTAPETLAQHLENQLAAEPLTPEERSDVERLIGYLDERGFISSPLREIVFEEGVSIDRLKRAKHILQGLEPAGVGAETLAECLLLQLERMGKADSVEYRLVSGHLDELARRRLPDLARKLKVPVERISQAAELIGSLNPRPAQDFAAAGQSVYVQPDLTVEKQNGKYVVILNQEAVPRLRISNTYKDLMARSGTGDEVRGYIRERIRSGKFFIQSIEQRQQTIRKITEELVARQIDFLDHGRSHLKPMNMAQLAEVVGVHETTVSRAVNGKYMQTPQGVYELRYFFTTGLEMESGESMSNVSVKAALQELVKNEEASKPYSDDAIVKKLHEQGIKLARRTVAKYRDELGILPSHLRKKY
ncbi:MAG: RNA polymerase factor sigma-54 [Verrucomicrobiales bacterium]